MKNKNYIPFTKERAAKVENIFEHPTQNGNYYSVYLKGVYECFWCDTVSEIYRVIDEHWGLLIEICRHTTVFN